MKINFDSLALHLRFIQAISLLVPRQSRSAWRQEWQAEIINRWQELQKRNRLNLTSKLDLSAKVAGATRDVASFENNKPRLVLGALNILVAFVLGIPAVQEFATHSVGDRQQPFLLSSAAILVSLLFIISAVAMLREWNAVRWLVITTGVLSLLVHVYGALPPHRNMGYLALLIGAGYGVVMILVYQRNAFRNLSM